MCVCVCVTRLAVMGWVGFRYILGVYCCLFSSVGPAGMVLFFRAGGQGRLGWGGVLERGDYSFLGTVMVDKSVYDMISLLVGYYAGGAEVVVPAGQRFRKKEVRQEPENCPTYYRFVLLAGVFPFRLGCFLTCCLAVVRVPSTLPFTSHQPVGDLHLSTHAYMILIYTYTRFIIQCII